MAAMNKIKSSREKKGRDVSKFMSGGCMNVNPTLPNEKEDK